MKSARQKEALAEIQIERANIWLAWQWAAHHLQEIKLLETTLALGNACWLGNWTEDGFDRFPRSAQVLALFADGRHVLPAQLGLSIWHSQFALWLGRLDETPLMDARRLAAELPPSSSAHQISALYHLVAAEIILDGGERESARRHAQQALGLYESLDDSWGQADRVEYVVIMRFPITIDIDDHVAMRIIWSGIGRCHPDAHDKNQEKDNGYQAFHDLLLFLLNY